MTKAWKQRIIEKILELFRESVIMQSALTLMLVGSIIVAWLYGVFSGQVVDIPRELWGFAGLLIGFWIKSKSEQVTKKLAEMQSKSIERLATQMSKILSVVEIKEK